MFELTRHVSSTHYVQTTPYSTCMYLVRICNIAITYLCPICVHSSSLCALYKAKLFEIQVIQIHNEKEEMENIQSQVVIVREPKEKGC